MSQSTLIFLFGFAFVWLTLLTVWVGVLRDRLKDRGSMSTDGDRRSTTREG